MTPLDDQTQDPAAETAPDAAAAPDAPALDAPDAEPLPGDGLLAPIAEDVPEAAGPRCRACGAPITGEQDWCLECGTATAAPRRLPGLRTVAAAGVLTLALAGGAVAASYAALTDEPPPPETKVQTLAQVTPPPTTTTDDVEPLPPIDDGSGSDDLEPLPPIDDGSVDPAPIDPIPIDPGTDTGGDTGTGGDDGSGGSDPEPKPDPKPGTTPIVLESGAGSLYDPDGRATSSGDPGRALDGSAGTSWFVTTPDGADMNVGYVIDLGKRTEVRKLKLTTKTPGFAMTVYGATTADPPQSIDGWTELSPSETAGVAGDDAVTVTLKLPKGPRQRQILLWFTTPPPAGATVRLGEIGLFT